MDSGWRQVNARSGSNDDFELLSEAEREEHTRQALANIHRMQREVQNPPKRSVRKTAPPMRRDIRPRLTWAAWLYDWVQALRSTGWRCCSRVKSGRYMCRAAAQKARSVYLYRKGVVLGIHSDIQKLPTDFSLDRLRLPNKAKIEYVEHIARGDGVAERPTNPSPFAYVLEHDGELYDGETRGILWFGKDSELEAIYKEYLAASKHHNTVYRTIRWGNCKSQLIKYSQTQDYETFLEKSQQNFAETTILI